MILPESVACLKKRLAWIGIAQDNPIQYGPDKAILNDYRNWSVGIKGLSAFKKATSSVSHFCRLVRARFIQHLVIIEFVGAMNLDTGQWCC